MELPAEVMIHNELLGMRGKAGSLLGVHPEGYYELTVAFGDSLHRLVMPIAATVLIAAQPEEKWVSGTEVER
jgi:hypothetical protein